MTWTAIHGLDTRYILMSLLLRFHERCLVSVARRIVPLYDAARAGPRIFAQRIFHGQIWRFLLLFPAWIAGGTINFIFTIY
jgi:hypothetical protein